MPTIAEAVVILQAADVPVLFADTSSLVDVIRAPMRPKDLKKVIQGGMMLKQLLEDAPARCKLVAPSFVQGEWGDHADEERGRLDGHLATLDEFAELFHNCCAHAGIAPGFGKVSYGNVGLVDRLYDLSKWLLDRAIHLQPQDDTNIRAFNRAIKCIPPSKKGGEVKDCTIMEETLEAGKQLRGAGFAKRLVFCTSNVNDYCEGGNLHPVLARLDGRVHSCSAVSSGRRSSGTIPPERKSLKSS
jgi:hypothetical protein